MERGEHLQLESGVQSDFVRDVVVEQLKDVLAVSALGRSRHPQKELRLKVVEDFREALGAGTMYFVDQDVVEGGGVQAVEYVLLRESLHRGENIALVGLTLVACDLSKVCSGRTKYFLELGDRSVEDLLTVGNKE